MNIYSSSAKGKSSLLKFYFELDVVIILKNWSLQNFSISIDLLNCQSLVDIFLSISKSIVDNFFRLASDSFLGYVIELTPKS